MTSDIQPQNDEQLLSENRRLRDEIKTLRNSVTPAAVLKTAVESERKYHELVSRMRSGVAIFTALDHAADFTCQSANPAYARITRRKPEALVGCRFTECFADPGAQELLAVMQQVWQTGVAMEHSIARRADNRVAHWHEHFVYQLPAGEVVIICDDLTAEKQLEESLRQSNARLRLLLDGLADGVLTASLATRHFTYANPAACAMFGYTLGEMQQLGVADIHPSESLPAVIAAFEAQARREKKIAYHLPCRHKDGHVFFADISTAPATDVDDTPCNIGIFRESGNAPA